MEKMIPLGRSSVSISPMGLGTMQWGYIQFTDQQGSNVDKDVRETFKVSLESGINFYDTAEMYGNGRSELYLGKYLKKFTNNIVVATKFMPFPWRLTKGDFRSALMRSLNRLGLSHVDLYQMHWPIPPVSIQSWMEAMSAAVADGLITAVGVSNYSPSQTRKAFDVLSRHSIPLVSNQVKYSLLDRRPERSGLTDLCKKFGVTLIAYSPLEKGILTGKYTLESKPQGYLSWRYNKNYLVKIEPVIETLHKIGLAHGGKTPSMVALNWLICKSAVPIPGARNEKQAQENAGALGWQLSTEEVDYLDNISNETTM